MDKTNFNFKIDGSNGNWNVKVASGKFTAENDFHTIKGEIMGKKIYHEELGHPYIDILDNQVKEGMTLFIERQLEEKRCLMYEWIKEAGDVDWNKVKNNYNF
jgi:hypothetical protein